jgi:DNA-binding FrmR family transcriptional regulator
MSKKYPCHGDEIKKLNRISGQIEGIKKMIDEGRYCPDILAQLRAARSAIRSIEANILETHLQHCVTDAMISGNKKQANEKISEIKGLFKRFDG